MLEHYTFQLHPAVQSRLSIHWFTENVKNWKIEILWIPSLKLSANFGKISSDRHVRYQRGCDVEYFFHLDDVTKVKKVEKLWDIIPSFKRKDLRKSILWAWFSLFHQISWVRIRDWHILTNGLVRFTTDDRFNVLYKEGSFNWILQVSNNSPPPHKGRTFLANFRGGRKRGGNILRREIFPYSGSPGKPELSQM